MMSTEYFKAIPDCIENPVFVKDEQHRYVFANNAFCSVVGVPREQLLGKTDYELFPKKQAKAFRKADTQVFQTGEEHAIEEEFPDAQGGFRVAVTKKTLYTDETGKKYIIGVTRDITEHKRAEDALLESEVKYRTIVENSLAGVSIYRDGRLCFVNERCCMILGYACEEMLGLNPADFTHPEDMGIFQDNLERLMSGRSDNVRVDMRVIRKDGGTISVHVSGSVITYEGRPAILVSVYDVTEWIETRERLRKSEEKFKNAFYTSPDSININRLSDGMFVSTNRGFSELTGYSEEEIAGRTSHEIDIWYNPGDRDRLTEGLRAQGKVDNLEAQFRLKNGEVRYGMMSATLIDLDGSPHVLSVTRDISARKQAEKALQESERKYRLLTEKMTDIVWIADLDLRTHYVTPSVQTVLGFSQEERMQQTIDQQLTPESLAFGMEAMVREFAAEEQGCDDPDRSVTLMLEYYHKNGSTRWMETTIGALRDDQGILIGLHGVSRDITERKRAVEEQMRLLHILESSLNEIYVFDSVSLFFEYVNRGALRNLGYTLDAMRGMTPVDLGSESTKTSFRQFISPLLRNEQKQILFCTVHRRADGSLYPVEVHLQLVEYNNRKVFLSVIQDITERKKAEEEREKLQTQLNQAQKMESVGRLAGGVAHDFNNALTAILGYVQMAMMRCSPSDPIHGDLKVIEDSALHSADLVRQLLAFARKQTIAPAILDLNDTVSGMLKVLRRLIGENIHFSWMPGADLWPVKIDPSQVNQLLANLCVNAKDAIAGVGGITIETENAVLDKACVDARGNFSPGEYVMLAVSDDGCGISKETIPYIFEPFFTTKDVGKGTGLGLATVYGIVKQNGGFINVYSEQGKGSVFRIYLPRFLGKAAGPPVEEVSEIPKGRGETVLLVEDDAVILTLGKAMLKQLGYKVLTAGTPGEALQLAKDRGSEISLLVTDVVMPEMNGRELAKLLKEALPGLKCLFTSGYTADVIARQGVLDEGVNFLEKPFSVKSMATKVRQVLDLALGC